RRRGIRLLPPDVGLSAGDFSVEGEKAIRVGLKQIKGLSRESLDSILAARAQRPYASALDFVMRTSVPLDELENLARCGALDSLCPNRRFLLGRISPYLEKRRARQNGETLLFSAAANAPDCLDFNRDEKRSWEYRLLGLYVGEHPMADWRCRLQNRGILSSLDLQDLQSGTQVTAAGLLLYPHRPPTRSGRITVFFSLEDEYGITDVTMFEDVYMQYGSYIFGPQNGPLLVSGRLQRRGEGTTLLAAHVSPLLSRGRSC
ncbi:MAG: error-prone DNA polymerase, partial [Syntrophomonadaceae bacterium]|nr:error-prone DNA polymerase [Syntrophomonadaceae bacterium]